MSVQKFPRPIMAPGFLDEAGNSVGGIALSDSIPETLGVAASGTSAEAARADHVHALPGVATTEAAGLVKEAAAIADVTGDAPTATEFNGLLAALRTAGLLATEYPCQGFPDNYSDLLRSSTIPARDSNVVLIAGLCSVDPAIGDRVQFQGQSWQARDVGKDPAGATWELQSFKVQA